MTEDARRWLVADGGRQDGPYTTDELVAAVLSGRVSPGAHAWADGMPSWIAVREVPEARRALATRGLEGLSTRRLVLLGSLSVGSGLLVLASNAMRALAGHEVSALWGGIVGAMTAPGLLMLWKAFRRGR